MSSVETVLDNIISNLESILKEISDFGNRVYTWRSGEITDFPAVIIYRSGIRRVEPHGHIDYQRQYNINLIVKHRGNKPDSPEDINAFQDLIGKIEDKLKDNRVKANSWYDLDVESTDLTFQSTATEIFLEANMALRVLTIW